MRSCLDGIVCPREGFLSMAFRRWRIQRRFFRRFGTYVNFDAPATSQEKIQYRKQFGNHALFGLLADKYRVRQFVEERVGSDILIPLLGVYEKLTPDVFDDLPDQFIIKANHGCKWHRIVRDKSKLDRAEVIRYFNKILQSNYAHASGEHHYAFIKPLIVIETLLVDQGDSPPDYHFYCFHSDAGYECAMAVSMPRGERFVYFDEEWNAFEGTCTPEEVERLKAPRNFDRMRDIARELSRGFDFLRIDLYNVEGKIFFGEITSTPASGMRKIDNPIRAAQRNAQWKLAANNPLLYQRRRVA